MLSSTPRSEKNGVAMKTMKHWWWLLPLFVLAVFLVGFLIWAGTAAAPMPEAISALESDSSTTVSSEPWYVFSPVDVVPETGLILYPGAKVDPRAYAPAARSIAEQGYLVVIVPMPLNLAILAPNRSAEIITAFPQVKQWAIGGHSLGGAMAARFAHQNSGAVEGLVLWAAYPASSDNLSTTKLAVSSIYGTLDGLASVDKIDASRPLLPPDADWVAIQGGNHAQFGWYGPQAGDNEATISREEQQVQIMDATLDLLVKLGYNVDVVSSATGNLCNKPGISKQNQIF